MSDSESEADLPSREECEQRCQKFAAITGTDSALAMFYLQDRDWNVDRALNAFFEEGGRAVNHGTDKMSASSDRPSVRETEDPEPHRFRLMSWNIDGLDLTNLKTRTTAVCDIIKSENPHVVFLQEVVSSSLQILEKNCPAYRFLPGSSTDYFTAVMLKKGSVVYEESSIYPFFSSLMMRNLLKVKCSIKGVPCYLMTSHLESTKEHAKERINQLTTAFKEMAEADGDRTVIFGGDLNARDPEIAKIGGIPEGIYDLWEVTGKRPEAKFTWDLKRNDNLEWNVPFRPRCRFDRLYIRHPVGATAVKPVYFELVGIERIAACKRFPSDHWGLLTHYDLMPKK